MIQRSDAAGLSRPPIRPAALFARVAELALTAILAWIAAQAFWFIVYGTDGLDISIDAPSAGVAPAQAGLDVIGAATGLFSTPQGATSVAQVMPETRLNMTLRGVRSGADGRGGSAVIETPNQGQRSIPVGGDIAPGVTLAEVLEDRVIINRNGARESLFLTEAAARRAREASVDPRASVAAPASAPDLEGVGALTREDWIEGLRLEPALDGGRLVGMRVREASADPLLRALGLQAGDVIVQLNGAALTSADAAARAARSLERTDQVTLTVRRGAELITLEASLP